MSHPAPSSPRILIVKLSSLGDLFHALPTVRCLKAGLGATVDWVAHTGYVDLVRCFTDVDRVIGFPRHNFWTQAPSFLRELRRHEYSHIIDLQGLLKSALVARLARGGLRIGPAFAREGSRLFYSAVTGPQPSVRRHAVEEALDVVRHLGLEVLDPAFPVAFPKRPRQEPHPRVAVIPCSRWVTKDWAADRIAEVVRAVRQRGATVFLAGGPGDAPRCADIERQIPGAVVNLCGKTSFVELGSLLQEMDMVVSVDSGPMHMAAAVGKPVLAVFGASDPKRTGPFGPQHRVVMPEGLDCWPCHTDVCRRKDIVCLRELPARRVVEAALSVLDALPVSA